MSDVVLDFAKNYGMNETDRLRTTLPKIGPDDTLTIHLEPTAAYEADTIFELLDEHNFVYVPKTITGRYVIEARRDH